MAAIGALNNNRHPTSKTSSQHQGRDITTIGIKSRMVAVAVKIVLAVMVIMVSTNRLSSQLEDLVGLVRSPHLKTTLLVVVEIIECANRAAVVGLMGVAATRVVAVKEAGHPRKIFSDKAVIIRTIDAPINKVKIR